ncbi:MAG: flagellar hook-associated protein FlgL [Clostridium sp.]|uniref:flagellar hook-associated protein FlgL n=1 Tax=Clostridium sp. TaxID=1506 RepID=UPI002915799E|nr:flagellar hook-associated protein FlgL [Clostridium sp.]MDU5110471.1 flagellar hook-associated protein FlgL [Clostridium sp.]
MIINHNMNALNAHRNMTSNTTAAGKSMEKLSSGLRINRAGDDAAGLAISEKMRGQIRGLDQASRNAQDGISMIQTAEGALNETHSIVQRMRELAVQAGNDTNTASDRAEIQKEINQLTSEVNRIGNTTEFNTQKLLNGEKDGSAAITGKFELKGTLSAGTVTIDGVDLAITGATDDALFASLKTAIEGDNTLKAKYDVAAYTAGDAKLTLTQKAGQESTKDIESSLKVDVLNSGKLAGTGTSAKLQIGANESQSMTAEIYDMRAAALGITGTADTDGFTKANGVTDGTSDTASEAALDVSNHDNASNAIAAFDKALNKVSAERSKLGAMQNRLEHTINNLGTSSENLTAAESRVRDVDMAKEMMTFSKNNILQQAAQAMLAQANQQPQGVLQLLR